MKIVCSQDKLSRGLNMAGRALSARAIDSSAADILLEVDNGRLRISASDLKDGGATVSCWIDATCDMGDDKISAISIPGKPLQGLIAQLPTGDIDLQISDSPLKLTIRQGSMEAELIGRPREDFPPHLEDDKPQAITFKAANIVQTLKRVKVAVAMEDSRPILTGVHFSFVDARFTVVAADGYRLAVEKGDLATAVESEINVTVPAKTASHISDLAGGEDNIDLYVMDGESRAIFQWKDVQIVTLLMQGSYPEYGKLIPTDLKTTIKADFNSFKQAVELAAVIAKGTDNIVRMVATKDSNGESTLKISSGSGEVGSENTDIAAEITGDEIKCAFNERFLNDFLSAAEGDQITFATASASSATLFTSASLDTYKHVIMPMFVTW